MAKVTKVLDPEDGAPALRITQRKARGRRGESFRIGCGCCNEGLVIFPLDPGGPVIEINGVLGTVKQWQQIFGPLLGMEPKRS